MAEIKINACMCERCEHVWVQRATSTEEPRVCPKCKSPYWNKPRKRKIKPKGKK